ncbi:hypothetical protein GCM10023185_30990 [Hymenobacter saemangeumensis]|uniref:Uncharacterized protein n=1 Tax=Hymenobacter saemangeumensis TaxID=1084522 RepID=A0ABP8IMG6_9BACT
MRLFTSSVRALILAGLLAFAGVPEEARAGYALSSNGQLLAPGGRLLMPSESYAATVFYDADAATFLANAGIPNTSAVMYAGTAYETTGAVIHQAIHRFVVEAKACGGWDTKQVIYPFVGGTDTAHRLNLKNPVVSNAAFALTYVGGTLSHSGRGMAANGTSQWADTNWSPNANVTQATGISACLYGTGPVTPTDKYAFGSYHDSSRGLFIGPHNSTSGGVVFYGAYGAQPGTASTTAHRCVMLTRQGGTPNSVLYPYSNGVLMGSGTPTATAHAVPPTPNVTIGVLNLSSGEKYGYYEGFIGYLDLGTAMPVAIAWPMYVAVHTLQTTLKRQHA